MCGTLPWGVPAGGQWQELFRECSEISTHGAGSEFCPTCAGVPELIVSPDWNDGFWHPLGMLLACAGRDLDGCRRGEQQAQAQASRAGLLIRS